MGSLRISELLGSSKDREEQDQDKCLRWEDLEIIEESEGKIPVKIIRLHLRQPKTVRSSPAQIVEIPQATGPLCPYMSYWMWAKKAGGRGPNEDPIFRMEDGGMLTSRILNDVLRELSPKDSPKITTRDFRGALATILARRGAKKSTLMMLGRWKSDAYGHYVKGGRANNWREMRKLWSTLQI